jgi:MFS family permease
MDVLSDQAEARHRGAKGGGGAYRWPRPPVLRHPALAVAAVLLIGFNLRPSITTVALFLGDIKRDLGLSVFGISVLAVLPVVCLGLFAPAAPALARRFGVETVLFVSLLGITIGSLVRSFGVAPLYFGTVVIGACLCFLGVLSPAVVKRDFPRHIGLMMGFYTMLVCVGPALSAATAVLFQHVLGGNWELVLVIWGLPALVGALAVVPRLFAHDPGIGVATPRVLDLLGLIRARPPAACDRSPPGSRYWIEPVLTFHHRPGDIDAVLENWHVRAARDDNIRAALSERGRGADCKQHRRMNKTHGENPCLTAAR